MGYQSPYMRFGHTRYEKNIAKLRRYDLNIREEAYKDAMRIVDEVDQMHDASLHYIGNVLHYASCCEQAFKRGLISDDDDATLVIRYGEVALDREEYDWMKGEFAKQGIDVESPWSSK